MYYSKYFPKNSIKEFENNRKLNFIVRNISYTLYDGFLYINDTVGNVPSEVNIKILSNNYYSNNNNKLFVIPIIRNNYNTMNYQLKILVNKKNKTYNNIIIREFSFANICDTLYYDENIEKKYQEINYNKDYINYYAKNLYISTVNSYLTAIAVYINHCDYIYFMNSKYTYQAQELIEWCNFFNISYEYINNNKVIKVNTTNKKEMNTMFENFSFEKHIEKVITGKVNYPLTLTEFLTNEMNDHEN